jgi:hypothetical protein
VSAHAEYHAELHLSLENDTNYGDCGEPLRANVTARAPYQFAGASGMPNYTVCPTCWLLYVQHRDADDTRRRAYLQAEKRFSENQKESTE